MKKNLLYILIVGVSMMLGAEMGKAEKLIPGTETPTPASESFAAQMGLHAIYQLDDGAIQVVVMDRQNNSHFSLRLGDPPVNGIELVAINYVKDKATLKKGEEFAVLSIGGRAALRLPSASEHQKRVE